MTLNLLFGGPTVRSFIVDIEWCNSNFVRCSMWNKYDSRKVVRPNRLSALDEGRRIDGNIAKLPKFLRGSSNVPATPSLPTSARRLIEINVGLPESSINSVP
jgi:hypothetical protein